MPLWQSPTPVVAIALIPAAAVVEAVRVGVVLAVETGTGVFLQGVPPVPAMLDCQQDIATHRSA